MCYYRLYIFLGCGHTSPSATPIRPCAAMRAKRPPREVQPVEMRKEHERRDSGNPLAGTDALPADAASSRSSGAFQHAPDSPDMSTSTSTSTSTSAGTATTVTALIPLPSPPHQPSTPDPDAETNDTEVNYNTASPCPCPSLSIHPFQTLNIHASCALCQRKRMALLERVEAETAAVRFDDWRWKVKYKASVPEEARNSLEWGRSVGEAMGSWVRARGQEVWRVLGEEDEDGRGGKGVGWRGSM